MNNKLKNVLKYGSVSLATLSLLGISLYSGSLIHNSSNNTYHYNTTAMAKKKCKNKKANYSSLNKKYDNFESYEKLVDEPNGGIAEPYSYNKYAKLKKIFDKDFEFNKSNSELNNTISFDKAYIKSLQKIPSNIKSDVDNMSDSRIKHYTNEYSKDGRHANKWFWGYHVLMIDLKHEENHHKYGPTWNSSCNSGSNNDDTSDLNDFFNPKSFDFNNIKEPSVPQNIRWRHSKYFTTHLEPHNNLEIKKNIPGKAGRTVRNHYQDTTVSSRHHAYYRDNWQPWQHAKTYKYANDHPNHKTRYVVDTDSYGNIKEKENGKLKLNRNPIKYDMFKDVGAPAGDQYRSSTLTLAHQHAYQLADNDHLGLGGTSNKNHRVIKISFRHGKPSSDSWVTIHYRDAAVMNGKPVDASLTLYDFHPYVGTVHSVPYRDGQQAWQGDAYPYAQKNRHGHITHSGDGPRSIEVSKSLARGYYLNGFISCRASYHFFKSGSHFKNELPISKKQIVGENGLDGENYQKKYVGGYGSDSHNTYALSGPGTSSLPYDLAQKFVTSNEKTPDGHYIPQSNHRAYSLKVNEVPRHYLVGKFADFLDAKGNSMTSDKNIYGYMPFRSHFYNFHDYEDNKDLKNQHTKGITVQKFRIIDGEREVPARLHGRELEVLHNYDRINHIHAVVMDEKPRYKTINVDAGRANDSIEHPYRSSFYHNNVNEEDSRDRYHSTYFTHSVWTNNIQNNNISLISGVDNGYGNFNLFADIPNINNHSNSFSCINSHNKIQIKYPVTTRHNDRTKTTTYNVSLSDFIGRHSRHFVSSTMFYNSSSDGTKPTHRDYYRWTEFRKNNHGQYIKMNGHKTRAFRNTADAKDWASTIKCIVPHRHHGHTTKPYIQPVRKSLARRGIHHARISGKNGGILKHPYQKYTYQLKSHLPNVNDNAYWTDRYKNNHYYNSSADDYNLSDVVPRYVSINGTPRMHIGRHTITPHVHGNYVEFHLTSSEMVAYANQHYTVDIPVKANHLPAVTKHSWNAHHWFRYWNHAHQNVNIYYGYDGNKDDTRTKNTNRVPVEIKKIKATIYHYDYNHNENLKHNFFPNTEQPLGFDNNCDVASHNPNSIHYKNYQFNKFFKPGDSLANGMADSKHSILQVDHKYGYAGATFGQRTINQVKRNHRDWRYRFVYPSFDKHQANGRHLDRQSYFKQSEQELGSRRFMNTTDDRSYGNRYVPIKFTPSGCYNTAYNKPNSNQGSGFSQQEYLPYIVPRISFIPNKVPSTKKPNNTPTHNPNGRPIPDNNDQKAINAENGQLIIDTDKQEHGLPFRFNMRTQNFLYGRHFYKDFSHDRVIMKIYSGNHKLYEAERHLVGTHNADLSYIGRHRIKQDEWPYGDHHWNGYIEKNALYKAYSDKYDLDTKKGHINEAIKPGTKIPIHVAFKIIDPSDDRISYRNLNSHAYTASNARITRNSFGKSTLVRNGRMTTKKVDPNTAIKARPERTIKYLDNPGVREIDESLMVHLPQNAYAKTGYGLTGNDLAIDYMGHLEASQYAHKGTNMLMAFPKSFNHHDSRISYSKDNRHPKSDADVMMHIQPNEKPTDNVPSHHVSYGENNNLPSPLDNSNVVDGVSQDKDTNNNDKINGKPTNDDVANADEYYNDRFKQNLHAGDFVTTYGFYPRQTTHNIMDQKPKWLQHEEPGINPRSIYNNGGIATIAKNRDEAKGYQSHSGYNDPSIHRMRNGLFSHSNGYGMNGITTKNTSNKFTHHTEDITDDGQNERMFTPIFMYNGKYNTFFERVYKRSRTHRLGGNFFDIDTKRPIHFYAHQYIAKDSQSKDQDEFSLQPVLTDPHGLSQVPGSTPVFPKDWLSNADNNNTGVGQSWKSIGFNSSLTGKGHLIKNLF